MAVKEKMVAGCLSCLAVSLLLVGIVSGTVLRHFIQILPIVPAIIVLARRPSWGLYAAMSIFLFWMLIMVLIWLYLLGISRIARGHYTTTEIILTVLIALCSTAGILLGRSLEKPRMSVRLTAFVCFTVLQLSAMWISFLKPLANR